ncbi:MAG: hypothetical protein IJO61_04090 [Oscillospiraceae bacterium]|nr:hypothetical protein [Oscillospiraceae bacterium]MBQ6846290.1 hypothetical protein [Oscillospiraceae bacterium]
MYKKIIKGTIIISIIALVIYVVFFGFKCDYCGGKGSLTCACNDGVCKNCTDGVVTQSDGSTLLCPRCKGTSVCGSCNGTLKLECVACEGTGKAGKK